MSRPGAFPLSGAIPLLLLSALRGQALRVGSVLPTARPPLPPLLLFPLPLTLLYSLTAPQAGAARASLQHADERARAELERTQAELERAEVPRARLGSSSRGRLRRRLAGCCMRPPASPAAGLPLARSGRMSS